MSNNFYNRGFACATPTIRGNHKRWTCATWSTPRWGDERRRQQITIDVRRWAEPIDQLSQRVAVAGLNRPTRIVVVSLTLFVRNYSVPHKPIYLAGRHAEHQSDVVGDE